MILKLFSQWLIYLLTLIAGIFAGWWLSTSILPPVGPGSFHSGLTIERLAELSELLVVRLDVSDVLVTSVHGRTGKIQAVVLVKGDVSLGVDLSAARFDNVDKPNRTAVLTLPRPGPSRPRLDHERTRVVLIQKDGLWMLSPASEPYAVVLDQAMLDAQDLVNSAGSGHDAHERARRHAEAVLQVFFRSLDWNVRIAWADQPVRLVEHP